MGVGKPISKDQGVLAMSHRNVFSQMFDVRPRKESGDLDLEKIEKIVKILNLRGDELPKIILPKEKIIDLKNQPLGLYVELELPGKRKRKVKKLVKAEKAMSNFDFWPEFSDETAPSQAEILSVLEMIEEADQALKKEINDNENDIEDNYDKDNEGLVEVVVKESPKEEAVFEIPIKTVEVEEIEKSDITPSFEKGRLGGIFENVENPPQPSFKKEGVIVQGLEIKYPEPDMDFLKSPPTPPKGGESLPPFREGWGGFDLQNEIIAPELLLGKKTGLPFKWKKIKKPALVFVATAVLVLSFFPVFGWFNKVLIAKNEALNSGMAAYQSLISAKEALTQFNFAKAEKDFKIANDYFSAADSQIRGAAGWLVFVLERLPGVSYFSSRTKLVKVGQDMSQAGQSFASIASLFGDVLLDFSGGSKSSASMSSNLTQARAYLEDGLRLLVSAKQNLEDIKISSLPKDIQPQLVLLEDKMPQIVETAALALDWSDKFLKILGHESAKKYLLVFQNNAEARPTGGFIGTYGVLDLDQGQIKNLFIDGIYNPDGQLKEKIIPPVPIQKISTAWSTHDANWFADFPMSAQKIIWFYEKTGGATVDGVISLTPTVIERLLKITGPIAMPEYGIVLSADNFIDATQQEIEVDYDKILNRPKKILADFSPKFIDKVAQEIKNNNMEILKVIGQAFKEKHILVYFSDQDLEQFVKQQSWGGEILPVLGDYLAVINTNINGYKTDRVVKEDINYASEIQLDGSVINTVSVTRRHQGGDYDWYKKVNSDYMRVFVPKGSELISASGQTRETVIPPIDYATVGFKIDSEISAVENSKKIDELSGTEIFEESDKTVFGNWVYVSPGESVTVIYKYRLPFKVDISKPANFSLTVQKQSGSIGSGFSAQIFPPKNCSVKAADNIEADLSIDRQFMFSIECQ